MSEDWTPGPWRIRPNTNMIYAPTGRCAYEGDDGYRPLATFQDATLSPYADDQNRNREANGHLIVAAPELYEALAVLADQHEAAIAGEGFDREHCDCPALTAAWAALAKARGEAP